MVYEEYYKKYLKKLRLKREINDLELRRVNLISLVNVQTIAPNDCTGFSNKKVDKMSTYVSELEEVDNNLKRKDDALKEINGQLESKKEELKKSNEILDRIYYYKYVENFKYYQIIIKIGYEKSSFYNFLNIIKQNLQKIKDSEKNGKN